MAVDEMTASEGGCARDDLVAGVEAVYAAGVEAAAGRDLGGAGNVSLEQDVLLLDSRVRYRDIGEQGLGIGMGRVLVDLFGRRDLHDLAGWDNSGTLIRNEL